MAKNRVASHEQTSASEMLPQTATETAEPVASTPDSQAREFALEELKAAGYVVRKGRQKLSPAELDARKAALALEAKDAKFARLAKKRGVKAIKAIRQLAHLANRSQYEWTTEQAANIVRQLTSEIVAIESKFKGNKTNGVTFSL